MYICDNISLNSSFSEKRLRQICRENQNMQFMYSYVKKNRVFYEIICINIAERDKPWVTIRCMRIACWIPKATSTHSEYVRIVVFLLHQLLRERVSTLCYTCIVLFNMKCFPLVPWAVSHRAIVGIGVGSSCSQVRGTDVNFLQGGTLYYKEGAKIQLTNIRSWIRCIIAGGVK
jgi:hypothetical protein